MADGPESWRPRGSTVILGGRAPGFTVALGVVGLLAALAGGVQRTRRLEAVERHTTLDATARAAWRATSSGAPHELSLGTVVIPARGSLRVSLCPVAPVQGGVTVVLSRHGIPLARVPCVSDDDRGGRCLTASWRTATAATVDALLASQVPPPTLREVDVRAGGVISPRDAWPMALLLLSLGVLVFAPRRRDPWSEIAAQGDGHDPGLDPWRAAVVASPVFVLASLLAVSFVLPVVVMLSGGTAHVLLYGLVLQPALMSGIAAVFLGAFEAVSPRAALGLGPLSSRALAQSLAVAGLLVTAALLTSVGLKNAGDSPIGQALASVPVRYAIALGALAAPMGEELFFRGALVSALGRRSVTAGVWASAVVFTGMHVLQLQGALLGLVPIALLGVANGYLRVYTRSLTAPWLVHTIYNTVLASSVLLAP